MREKLCLSFCNKVSFEGIHRFKHLLQASIENADEGVALDEKLDP
ncbi:MAG: hypothetical protein V6Z78_04290 [Holosporaceae bacterium]